MIDDSKIVYKIIQCKSKWKKKYQKRKKVELKKGLKTIYYS